VLHKAGESFLVQCKQWRAQKVGVEIVREMYGLMAAAGATGGFVVTSGDFTAEAKKFAEGRNVVLLNGLQLTSLLSPVATKSPLQRSDEAAPPCPNCGSVMVKRTASRGKNAGQDFLGCSKYPKCGGTRALG
jgi:restriction system protein